MSDPDAFCISKQTIAVKGEFPKPLTQSEAETSIVLAAVSGGMFEIGDDLPTLGAEPERLALVTNQDLLRMAKLSRASVPLDLMTYTPEDEQASIFFLRENRRQAMLAVFNWTEQTRSHTIRFVELQLTEGRPYKAFDVLAGGKPIALGKDAIPLTNQPPHSVRLLKIVDSSIPPAPPTITVHAPATGIVGTTLHLTAEGDASVSYCWNFGDGTTAAGSKVEHAYTAAGDYPIELTAEGVDGSVARRSSLIRIRVTGAIRTPFPLSESRRYAEH